MLGTGDASSAYVFTRILELWRTLSKLYTTSNRWSRVGKSTAVMSETCVNSAAVLSRECQRTVKNVWRNLTLQERKYWNDPRGRNIDN